MTERTDHTLESTDACYIFTPAKLSAGASRPSKRRKVASSSTSQRPKLPALLDGKENSQLSNRRFDAYYELWQIQERKLESVLKHANAETVHQVHEFLIQQTEEDYLGTIPAGFITAGLATSSSGSIFSALADLLGQDQSSLMLSLAPTQCSNLRTALKSIILEATQQAFEDDENEESLRANQGIRLLNYDLRALHDLAVQNSLKQCILFFQDSEALDGGVLSDLVDVLCSWSDRIRFVTIFEIATSIDLFQEKLSRQAIDQLSGTSFESKSSSEILDILFKCATYPDKDQLLWLGAGVSRLLLDRQTENIQSARGFVSAMKYMYMIHFFSNPLSVLVPGYEDVRFTNEHLSAIRSLPSFKRWIQDLLDERENRKASQLMKDNTFLIKSISNLLDETRESLRTMFQALEVLQTIYVFAPSKANLTWSALYIKAMTGDLSQSTVIRELSLSVKRLPSDVMSNLLEALRPAPDLNLQDARAKLVSLTAVHSTSGPLRSEHDANHSTLRTTIVAQKVSLSKDKATLSMQDTEYSKIVNQIDLTLREFLTKNIISPKELVLHEVFVFDSKSACRDALGPSPRQAIERALASPHDYLACECCEGEEGLKPSQPATAIVYQLYLESGALINVADLWAAYCAIVGPQSNDEEANESDEQTELSLFYRALAELKYLGMIKGSRKKTDHVTKLRSLNPKTALNPAEALEDFMSNFLSIYRELLMHRLSLHVNQIRTVRSLASHKLHQCFVPHQIRRCFRTGGAIRKDEEGGNFVVRHWEEIGPGKYREVKVDEQQRAAEELKTRIEELEKQLKDLSSDKTFDLLGTTDDIAEEQDIEEDDEEGSEIEEEDEGENNEEEVLKDFENLINELEKTEGVDSQDPTKSNEGEDDGEEVEKEFENLLNELEETEGVDEQDHTKSNGEPLDAVEEDDDADLAEFESLLDELEKMEDADSQDLTQHNEESSDVVAAEEKPLEPATKEFVDKLQKDLAQHLPALKLTLSNQRAEELAKLSEAELGLELAKETLMNTDWLKKSVPSHMLEGILSPDEEPEAPQFLGVQFPKYQRAYLRGFNETLQQVARNPENARTSAILWTKYIRCKQFLPEFLEQVPPPVWEVLWAGQYVGNPVIATRTEHLWILVDDMVQVGQDLSPDQKLVRIESAFAKGQQREAIMLWKVEWADLDKEAEKYPDFRDLGIRLYTQFGELKAAYNLAFDTNSKPRSDEIATMIATWAQKEDESDLKVAWSLYLELRRRLGAQMHLEDYDQIVMAFLNARQSHLALGVFRDLVLSGKVPSLDSSNRDHRSLQLLERLQHYTTGVDDLTQVSLTALTSIPKEMENKFFYASWLKRLIGLGETDSTIPVLALMYERGIRPDARHLNGILGAWFRGQNKERHNLGLQMAWSMVKERIKLVARRNQAWTEEELRVETPDPGLSMPPYISKNLPPANTETFCLLLLYYQRRSMHKSMSLVEQFLHDAELMPNSFFMNHLIYGELRKGDVRKAWKIYQSMRQTVKPDLETFAALWDCEKLYASGRAIPSKESFPTARSMFNTMMDWLSNLGDRERQTAQQEFTQGFYNQIVRSFCFLRDNQGTLIALHALRNKFGFYPDTDTVRIILVQLARSGEKAPTTKRRRVRFSSSSEGVKNMTKISEIFDAVVQERSEALRSMGVDEMIMGEVEKGEELLYQLSEVLRIFLRYASGLGIDEVSPFEENLDQLAWEMGVGGIDLSPPQYVSEDEG